MTFKFYVETDNILFEHINKNRHLYNGVITIVLHGLRDLFWMNKHMLPTYEQFLLEVMMSGTKLPTFKNILELIILLK